MRPAAALACVLLLAGCGFAKRHPRVTTVSVTTAALSAGLGLPLSSDCNNPSSTCSTRHTVAVFGIGAAVGLALGLVVVHERGAGDPAPPPAMHPATAPGDVERSCRQARVLLAAEIEWTCAHGTTAIPALYRECWCTRRGGVTSCGLDAGGTCRGRTGGTIAIGASWGPTEEIATDHALREAGVCAGEPKVTCACEDRGGCVCVATAACAVAP